MFHTLLRALLIKRDFLAASEKEYPSTFISFDNLSTSQRLRPKWIQVPLPLLELASWMRLGNEWGRKNLMKVLWRESREKEKERNMICKWKSNMFVNQPTYIKNSGLNNRRGNLVFVTSLLIKEEGREWVQEREREWVSAREKERVSARERERETQSEWVEDWLNWNLARRHVSNKMNFFHSWIDG